MWKQLILTLSVSSAMAVSAVGQTRDGNLAGVVTKVEQGRMEIRTDAQETISVSLSPETRHLKWISAKPWQQDPRVSPRFVHVGSRVHVELTADNPRSARTVWIVVGRPGFD
jgi:hypothetical protein